jgi:tight adherence protein B
VTALAAVCGAGVGLGLVVLVGGLRGGPPARTPGGARVRVGMERATLRLGLAAGAGVLVGVATRWPVGAVLAAGAGALAPELAGGAAARRAAVARTEAVAGWAEMLRDTLAGAAGLEQAILASAPVAPTPIRAEVTALAVRLGHQPLPAALRAFADDLADPTGDLVAAALLLAADRHARRLGELLGALAAAARDDATMRLRIDAARARTRASARIVLATTGAMAAGLVVVNRGYLAPYDTATGQLVLALVGLLLAGACWWLARIARPDVPQRLLATPKPAEEAAR